MKIVELGANKRTQTGKKAAKAVRAEGNVPAIIYGGGAPEIITVSSKEMLKALSTENGKSVILQLGIDGGKKRHALLQEIQFHPLTDKIFHADFLEIDIKKPLKATVPLKFKGDAVGIKIQGGVLAVHIAKVHIEGLPESLPTAIEVNIADLNIGDKIKVSEIKVPAGIQILEESEAKVVSVAAPKAGPGGQGEATAEGAAPAAEGAAATAAAPAASGKSEKAEKPEKAEKKK